MREVGGGAGVVIGDTGGRGDGEKFTGDGAPILTGKTVASVVDIFPSAVTSKVISRVRAAGSVSIGSSPKLNPFEPFNEISIDVDERRVTERDSPAAKVRRDIVFPSAMLTRAPLDAGA